MINRTLATLGFFAALGFSAALSTASAGCNPPKPFTLGFAPAGDYRIDAPSDVNADINSGVVKGHFWQAGNRAAANEGSACPEATYLVQTDPSEMTIFGLSGGDVLGTGPCDNQGCVAGNMIIVVHTLSNDGVSAYYAAGKVSENVDGHDYSRGGTDWTLTEIPRPNLVSSSRNTQFIILNFTFGPPSGAHGEADAYPRSSIVTGYQLMRFGGLADPGRNPAMWTNYNGVLPVSEGGAMATGVVTDIAAECPGQSDSVFYAVRLVFDNGQFLGDYVGRSTRVQCHSLAEPRFNSIKRPKSGRDATRTNPR